MSQRTEWSPTELWGDFSPSSEDLDLSILSTFPKGEVEVQELTYVSHRWEGEPVLVYGFYAAPEGATECPGLLHIHGGGQTASAEHVAECAERGYAALSFDWTGPHPEREKVTQFGEASTDNYLVAPSPHYSHLYHGAAIARRGLTLLEQRPEVDADRLGIYGISWGGFLSWLVNGSDSRVKAAVAIYGCGGTLKWGNLGGEDFDPGDEDQRTWNLCLNPFSYAEHQSGPMLFLNSTNDFFGWMDTAEELYTILPKGHALCFSPHFNHHLDEGARCNLYPWLDTHVRGGPGWPALPEVELELSGRFLTRIGPHTGEDVVAVEAFLACNTVSSPSRYWSACRVEQENGDWIAPLEILDPDVPHTVFVTVHYGRGISLSSIPQTFRPSDLGEPDTLAEVPGVIDDFSEGLGAWYLEGQMPDPFPEPLRLVESVTPDGGPALSVEPVAADGDTFGWNVATRKIADPRWRALGRDKLHLWLKVGGAAPLHVRLTHRPSMSDAVSFQATIDDHGAGWNELELTPKDFKCCQGDAELNSFDLAHLLEIFSSSPVDSPPAIGRLEWFEDWD